MKFTDAQRHAHVRLAQDLIRSAEGRSWGRPLLTEIGKGPAGDFSGKLNEMLDQLADVIRDLYTAQKPVQSR